MATISLTYNENNVLARKTLDYILSLGVFKVFESSTSSRKKTIKAIKDAKENRDVTICETFDDYLKAVKDI